MDSLYNTSIIGYISSPFKEKFGIPRQPGINSTIESKICLEKEFSSEECVRGLENFSHIWVIFKFHENVSKGWSNLVRPPRLGGNKKVGVFASRSPFRPNFTGISVVKLLKIEVGINTVITISGGDFMDKTPVIDIKPYILYSDSIEDAVCKDFELKPQKKLVVTFSDKAKAVCMDYEGLENKLSDILSYDPRPAYYNNDRDKECGMKFDRFDIRFKVCKDILNIQEIIKL
ncbi:MAG: tRNA (N6-threonylcarbamoyladenosine(37)-N6)-methyltransferase TrmO [Deltaproteobacteria bacterium]|nr:MAG: tRNA (N6-threonylcarbamoyladenosine(37)-N6)-methyltransferase TrmO [Deltaproteobacteria bacterium]